MTQRLKDMTETEADEVLAELSRKMSDSRYTSKLALWAIVERCKQIDTAQ